MAVSLCVRRPRGSLESVETGRRSLLLRQVFTGLIMEGPAVLEERVPGARQALDVLLLLVLLLRRHLPVGAVELLNLLQDGGVSQFRIPH